MAFTGRANRQTGHFVGNTPSSVGPGSYGAYFNHEVEHAYAPFSSTSDRDMGGAIRPPTFLTPGPGSYNVNAKRYQGGPRYLTSPSNVGFLSKAERGEGLTGEALLKPGPGAYSIKSSFGAKQNRHGTAPSQRSGGTGATGGGKNVVWFRAPTAPSIPMQNQAYGYEEGTGGQLVKQKPPVETHTGTRGDLPGPGNYDPTIAPTRPNVKGIDFGRSRAQRSTFKGPGLGAADAPGPGAYEAVEPKAPNRQRKPTSNFASRVLRPHQIERDPDSKVPVPGPGAYSIPDSFVRARQSLPDSLQCFSSTSKRLDDFARNRNPGPGSYEDPRTIGTVHQKGGPMPSRAAPFLSTGSRFGDKDPTQQVVPGPGTYDEENRNTFVAQLAKKRFSRAGAFGSKAQRFVPSSGDDDKPEVPGPAHYNPKEPKQIQGQLKKGHMSAFVSTSTRFNKQQEEDAKPAPGQYYKTAEWGTGYKPPDHAARTAFFTSSKRFDLASKKELPGPGAYSQETNTLGSQVQTVLKKKALFGEEFSGAAFGTEQRFFRTGNGGRNAAPGPGSYDAIDPYSQLLKRSFNITVEGSI